MEHQRLEQREMWHVDHLNEVQDEKNFLVYAINSQWEAWEAAYLEFQAQSMQIEEAIQRILAENRRNAIGSGIYVWPLPLEYSTVSSHFGWRPDPFGGSRMNLHNGMDIAAPTGVSIFAVDAGVVIMAEIG
jgi:murein DD-endopeptidase MepM/ murein hydrolase activator NlpD